MGKNDAGRLSANDIERMLEDAEKFKADDEAKRARIGAKDELSSYITQMQTTMEGPEVVAKLPAYDVTTIENSLSEAMEWLEINEEADKEEISKQKRQLERKIQPLFS